MHLAGRTPLVGGLALAGFASFAGGMASAKQRVTGMVVHINNVGLIYDARNYYI